MRWCGGFETKHLTICKVLFLTTFKHFCTVKEEESSTKSMAWQEVPGRLLFHVIKSGQWIATIRVKQTDGNGNDPSVSQITNFVTYL
jgi:hypothetical protein